MVDKKKEIPGWIKWTVGGGLAIGGIILLSRRAAAAPPNTGSLKFITSPVQADVYIGAVKKGTTGTDGVLVIPGLPVGPIGYAIKKAEYNDATGTVNVVSGAVIDVPVALSPITPTTGEVCFKSNPKSALIYVNGNLQTGKSTVGSAENCTSVSTISELNPGNYTYKVTLTGYQDKTGSFSVVAGQTVIVDAGDLIIVPVTGSVCIKSNPSGASIYIDDVLQSGKLTVLPTAACTTGSTVSGLNPVSHTYKLKKTGYQDKTGTFSVTAGQTTTVDAGNLVLLPTTGSLQIGSTPSGAKIYIDNTDQGATTPATIHNIPPGSHSYKLVLTGYEIKTGSFSIVAGQTTNVSVTLTTAQIGATNMTLDKTSCTAPCNVAASVTWKNNGTVDAVFKPGIKVAGVLTQLAEDTIAGGATINKTFDITGLNVDTQICPDPN